MSENTEQNQPPAPPTIKYPEDMQPEYSNLVRITHSPSELVMDFARLLPGDLAAEIQSRIIMSPLGAKLFYRALAENLARYETSFGEIKIPGQDSLYSQLFKPPSPPKGS